MLERLGGVKWVLGRNLDAMPYEVGLWINRSWITRTESGCIIYSIGLGLMAGHQVKHNISGSSLATSLVMMRNLRRARFTRKVIFASLQEFARHSLRLFVGAR
jgi:hypothetical protein